MSTTIESLELEIVSNSKSAVAGIDALTQSLTKLRNATKGGAGLTPLSKDLKNLNENLKKAAKTSKTSTASFTDLFIKLGSGAKSIRRVGEEIWSAIKQSSDYEENVHLFNVAMGEYANEAMGYAEQVRDIMGIDPNEWIRSQGVFMTLATGFGVASDRANEMSQNLTQLGYDLASFYNMDVDDAMQKLQSGLAGELEPLRRIGYDLSQAKLEATAVELGITKSVSAMTQAEKAQLRYYAIMTQVTDTHGDMAATLESPANMLRVLKSEFNMATREIGNLFIPALQAILPWCIAITRVIRNLATNLAGLLGIEMSKSNSATSAMAENTDAVTQHLEDSQKEAKKLKSYMLGFDELNVINPNTGGDTDTSSEFEFELPTYDFLSNATQGKVEEIVTMLEESLAEIGMVIAGATLAVGAVLAFTGVNIPLGIALMAGGAIGLVSNLAVNWSSMENPLTTTLGTLGGIVGAGALTLGALLAFTGVNVPLGIALIAMGAVSLVTAIALNWEATSEPVRQAIGTIGGIVGGAMLVLGAIMAFSGFNIPLGIALMAGGAISLVSAVALNWETLSSSVSKCITTLEYIVSGALLGVGAVLAFTGANIPLGIALMAVGAVTLGTAIAMNTSKLSDEVKEVIAIITSAVSLALLAVGAILAFTGVNIPLGIALMAGGALLMGTAILPNWNELSEDVQDTISLIMTIVGGALLVVGAILAFTGVGIPLGIGLMLVGAAALGTAVALNWDAITEAMQGPVGAVAAILGGALLVLGAILLFTGVGIPLGIGLMLAGAASLGTAVAFNWDFLVDKIKEIWDNICDFWDKYIAPIFTADWWVNLGKTCINGLISGFEGGINGIIGAFESMINWIVDGLNKISFDIPEWLGGGTFGINLPRANFGRVSIPRLAEGGFPEIGQMFIAREAGAEMVGNIGRRTAVANNDQIVDSIAGGVAQVNEEQNVLLREQNSLLRALLEKDSSVYLDGKNLTNSVEKYQRDRGRVLISGGVI